MSKLYISVMTSPTLGFYRDRSPGATRRTRKERRWRVTNPAAAQAFSTTVIPRTRFDYSERAALQKRITDGTKYKPGFASNRTLTVSESKGSESDSDHRLYSRIS
ncbi:hypothetical protein PSTG_09898 [Puccinia striiformis f. sp. tritici PST-78]|uniref:Uncharacterized protein n=1 Tax=Puccinia striiformis f. sp. tritici PST-78 TaxID=1165861 RepID=A0A0L0VC27_9BASI|nr:hypothetical protein PSTG_09898 [Puccinia striiformis f. sp. tritici PST-78]